MATGTVKWFNETKGYSCHPSRPEGRWPCPQVPAVPDRRACHNEERAGGGAPACRRQGRRANEGQQGDAARRPILSGTVVLAPDLNRYGALLPVAQHG